MGERNWTDKDWKWLMGILIGIIILILSLWFADYKGIEANFSIMSSAVSIALGLVAIYIALKQDSDAQRLNQQMKDTLNIMENKIDKVDQKVNKLDTLDIEKTVEENMELFVEQIAATVEKKSSEISKKDIQQVFEDAAPYVARNISKQLNSEKEYSIKYSDGIQISEKHMERIKEVADLIFKEYGGTNSTFDLNQVYQNILYKYSIHSPELIKSALEYLCEEGKALRIMKQGKIIYGIN
ncbi:hypothetical protein [Bacillus paramycoides]|uniref:hypothetical protein n=1 Tax=Bacillus paramycoides TaxID=2026194 RepID=UPI002E1D6E77|nr:hypothetical protein [Bacillus paramycoides]